MRFASLSLRFPPKQTNFFNTHLACVPLPPAPPQNFSFRRVFCSQIREMIFEVELQRDVPILSQNLDCNGLISKRSIVTRLLEDLLIEKASEDHGYFLAVTSLKSIGKGEAIDDSGDAFFPVVFNCRIFMPHKGEVLQGTVYHVKRSAVLLRCGPTKLVFLSPRKMPNYYFLPGKDPAFLNFEFGKIQKDVVVQFVVLDVKWNENREFAMLASIEGKSLGPVSSSGSDELTF